MAKTSSLRGQRMTQKGPKRTKTAAAPKARKAARKAPAKAPKAGAARPKAARKAPARRAQPKGTLAEPSALPRKAASPLARRRARAPPARQPGSKAERVAEHLHQDPRLAGPSGVGAEPGKVQTFNYGQFKNKAVARFDKPVNWFRRAPRPKQ
jgi:hypothetical protein